MSLDGVEFLMALEHAFDLRIPDRAALALLTPRNVIEHVQAQLPHAHAGIGLPQRAFYRLSDVLSLWFCLGRWQIRPETKLLDLLPEVRGDDTWAKVGEVFDAKSWPLVSPRGWLRDVLFRPVVTVGDAAKHVAARMPSAIKLADDGWTRGEVTWVVDQLMWDQLGIREYSRDDEFVRDLGVD